MSKGTKRMLFLATLVGAIAQLAACGGSDGETADVQAQEPAAPAAPAPAPAATTLGQVTTFLADYDAIWANEVPRHFRQSIAL
jgi:hypothetical protein